MAWFDVLAEKRIEAARDQGLLDDLPGRGRPIDHGDYFRLPRELRATYGLMKAQGFVPEEFELRGEIRSLEQLVSAATDPATAADLRQQLRVTRLRLDWLEERNGSSPALRQYRDALIARCGEREPAP